MIDICRLVRDARDRIGPHIRYTPLEPSVDLGKENGGKVFLKLENVQHTGSFKVRGALNRLLALDANEKSAGVVTASSGNHGMATAFGMNRLGIDWRHLPARERFSAESPGTQTPGCRGPVLRIGLRSDREPYARRGAELNRPERFTFPHTTIRYVVGGQGTSRAGNHGPPAPGGLHHGVGGRRWVDFAGIAGDWPKWMRKATADRGMPACAFAGHGRIRSGRGGFWTFQTRPYSL